MRSLIARLPEMKTSGHCSDPHSWKTGHRGRPWGRSLWTWTLPVNGGFRHFHADGDGRRSGARSGHAATEETEKARGHRQQETVDGADSSRRSVPDRRHIRNVRSGPLLQPSGTDGRGLCRSWSAETQDETSQTDSLDFLGRQRYEVGLGRQGAALAERTSRGVERGHLIN